LEYCTVRNWYGSHKKYASDDCRVVSKSIRLFSLNGRKHGCYKREGHEGKESPKVRQENPFSEANLPSTRVEVEYLCKNIETSCVVFRTRRPGIPQGKLPTWARAVGFLYSHKGFPAREGKVSTSAVRRDSCRLGREAALHNWPRGRAHIAPNRPTLSR
jgi:hypothetical protein